MPSDLMTRRKAALAKAKSAKKKPDAGKHYGKGQGAKAFGDSPKAQSTTPGAKAKRHAASKKLLADRKKALKK